MKTEQSFRSKVVTRRTYNRPLNAEGTEFETWPQTVDRVIGHQQWLWERALDKELNSEQVGELEYLRSLMLSRKTSLSGRTLWLGGTETAKRYEASMFNCSGLVSETVYDIVDSIWLLMQGCGVGFKGKQGTLTGFRKEHEVLVVRSTRDDKGMEDNEETIENGVWTIKVGDSAKAWSKAAGKLLVGKHNVDKLVLDFSEIRPAGERLKGYGWISSGDEQVAKAFTAIADLLNKRTDSLLSRMDILDVENWLGTILSSRRSAEIALYDYGSEGWEDFVNAKKDYWLHGNDHRQQSNNSLLFHSVPSRDELSDIFSRMVAAGGSEPGFINAVEAEKRAPWFQTLNPCAEILLPNKGFCNLVEINVNAFDDFRELLKAIRIMARANYRQTCVDLRDGILQEAWHVNNEFLRLCGVGLTGVAQRPDLEACDLQVMRREAHVAANSMADELGTPHPKNVTTIKPSGTLSKVMDCTEGLHKPLGKYIINNIGFSKHDPLVTLLRDAGYKVFDKPGDSSAVIAALPVSYDGVDFDSHNGTEVNLESAIEQLERYKLYQENWTDQNTSVTISYDPSEVDGIVDWLLSNWNCYVGVSFIFRNDPTKTARDLGYDYLPQEVVTKEEYEAYVSTLKDVDLDAGNSHDEMEDDGCDMGVCPVR